jgi:hypothetical protein
MTEYVSRKNQDRSELGWIGDGLVHQHDRNAVPHRVYAAALGTLQTLSILLQLQRLLAGGADQDIKQVLRNHGRILHPFEDLISTGPFG